jgi:glycosyltransferase involved in cell wall biosynthesis
METNNKILMIAATPFFSDRGCHIRIYNEIKYLKRNNIDIALCTYHLGYNPLGIDENNIKRIANISWYKKITPGASWGKIYLDFLLLILSFKEYLKNKPKIIHAHLYEGLIIAWLVKILTFSRVKIIFDCQGSLSEEMYQYTLHKNKLFKIFYSIFCLIEKISLCIPDKILCSSKNSFDFIKHKYNISDNKIDILDDGIDDEMFKKISIEEKIEARNEYKIPNNNRVIVYTGSMAKAKGVDELLEVLPELIRKDNKLTFIFAGYGELEEYYKDKYTEYVKNGNVIFIGRFSYFTLPKILALADYAIDPKKDSSESSGKIFNYMAVGLPVICFKNEFNISLLEGNAIYIKDFFDILSIQKQKESNKIYPAEICWNKIIKKLINNYLILE